MRSMVSCVGFDGDDAPSNKSHSIQGYWKSSLKREGWFFAIKSLGGGDLAYLSDLLAHDQVLGVNGFAIYV